MNWVIWEVRAIKKSVIVYTLGCKVNQVESENIKLQFANCGYEPLGAGEKADVFVVNTCAVTHVSERKSRAALRRAKRKNPEALVVATGCLAQIAPGMLASMPEVDMVVGKSAKDRIAELVQLHGDRGAKTVFVGEISDEPLRPGSWCLPAYERTRAFVKIQDGCDSYCSYCIVPYARGPVRSKPPDDVVYEIDWLVGSGFKEIVITGIHTGMYGKDLTDCNLAKLLKKILAEVPGDYRVRLSSLEPTEVSDELIDLVAGEEKLCRHFHVPLQSGSDRVLRLMNRVYTRRFYESLIKKIVKRIPGVGIKSDVMVGFPTETEEDFGQTKGLIEELPFAGLHVFPYSPRPKTPASTLYPQVQAEAKAERSRELLELARQKRQSFIESCSGQTFSVLVEDIDEGRKCEGLTDNYIRAEFTGEEAFLGRFVSLRLSVSAQSVSWQVVNDDTGRS